MAQQSLRVERWKFKPLESIIPVVEAYRSLNNSLSSLPSLGQSSQFVNTINATIQQELLESLVERHQARTALMQASVDERQARAEKMKAEADKARMEIEKIRAEIEKNKEPRDSSYALKYYVFKRIYPQMPESELAKLASQPMSYSDLALMTMQAMQDGRAGNDPALWMMLHHIIEEGKSRSDSGLAQVMSALVNKLPMGTSPTIEKELLKEFREAQKEALEAKLDALKSEFNRRLDQIDTGDPVKYVTDVVSGLSKLGFSFGGQTPEHIRAQAELARVNKEIEQFRADYMRELERIRQEFNLKLDQSSKDFQLRMNQLDKDFQVKMEELKIRREMESRKWDFAENLLAKIGQGFHTAYQEYTRSGGEQPLKIGSQEFSRDQYAAKQCPSCGKVMAIFPSQIGAQIRCPYCGATYLVQLETEQAKQPEQSTQSQPQQAQ